MQQPPTQQQQSQEPAPQPEDRLGSAVTIAAWIALWYLFGPAPARGYALRKRLAYEGNIWHAQRRWDQHTSVALAWPLLCWAILAYFCVPVVTIWGAIFSTVAGWIHLPVFALLGDASLFPPTPGNLLFCWLICAPPVPLIARTLEELQPQTQYTVERVVTEEEQQAHVAISQAGTLRAKLSASSSSLTLRACSQPLFTERASSPGSGTSSNGARVICRSGNRPFPFRIRWRH